MSLQVLPDFVQGTDEWYEARRGLVTASVVQRLISVRTLGAFDYDCPKCGAAAEYPCLSKRRTGEAASIKSLHRERAAVSVAHRADSPPVLEVADNDESRGLTALLTAERITGYTDPTYTNFDMLRGHEDEPRAVETYSQHYAPVTTVGFMVRDDWGFRIGYSPDGLVGEDGLIEVKSRRQKTQLKTVLSGEVPAENMAQLQCGLLVSGRQWIDYVSYCGGMRMWVKRVTRDLRWFNAIVAATWQFEAMSAEMIAAYTAATQGLPLTERVDDSEMVI